MITIDRLKELGEEGLIPGPQESEGDFVKRVDTLKKIFSSLKEGEYEPLTCDFQGLGAEPRWIPQSYSNRRLLPWQGAAAWIFNTDDGIQFPLVQLRTGFKRGHFLFYSRE